MNTRKVQLDLGCGMAKAPWHIGLDCRALPGVDHVLDLTTDRLPFDDDTVDEVFSAHFLDLVDQPDHLFSEIGRVCRDGARLEFWTPYVWSNEAFLYGHVQCISEELWRHLGILHRDAFVSMLGGRWVLRRFVFVVDQATLDELSMLSIDVGFAVKYLKGVVREFGVEIEFRRDLDAPALEPERVYAVERFAPRRSLDIVVPRPTPTFREELHAFASSVIARARARVDAGRP